MKEQVKEKVTEEKEKITSEVKIESKKKNYTPESIEFANYIYDSLDKLDLTKYLGSSYFGYGGISNMNVYGFDFIGLAISKDYSSDGGDDCFQNTNNNVHVIFFALPLSACVGNKDIGLIHVCFDIEIFLYHLQEDIPVSKQISF